MKRKNIAIASIGVVTLGSLALLLPLGVYAAESSSSSVTSFVQKLSAKLGIDENTVQAAVDSTKEELRSEYGAFRSSKIADAVTAGKLTQRQADILNAIHNVKESLKTNTLEKPLKGELRGLTESERIAKRESMRNEMDQILVGALNKEGLNTSLEEIQSTQEAAQNAGLGFGTGAHKGQRGMGF